MYVEISPRQTGKTTRLLENAIHYITSFRILRQRFPIVALVGRNSIDALALKGKLEVMYSVHSQSWPPFSPLRSVNSYMDNVVAGFGYQDIMDKVKHLGYGFGAEPDVWFVDEFPLIQKEILFPNGMEPMEGYYCGTPNTTQGRFRIRTGSLYYLADYCQENDIEIKFHNNWTESRLQEEGISAEYMREAILGDWYDFMEYYGFEVNTLKEVWISKTLKRHKLC